MTVEAIKKLFRGETLSVTGKLHSTEHERDFDVQDAKLQILKEQGEPNESGKYRLSIDGQNIIDWFNLKYQEVTQATNYYKRQRSIKPEEGKSKGIKM